jgi:hypothetical protein
MFLHLEDSDHFLVRIKIRQRIGRAKEGTNRRSRKWDVIKLQHPDIRSKYEKSIAQKLNEIDPNPDIELEWDNLKKVINDAAYDEFGKRINTKKSWMV